MNKTTQTILIVGAAVAVLYVLLKPKQTPLEKALSDVSKILSQPDDPANRRY